MHEQLYATTIDYRRCILLQPKTGKMARLQRLILLAMIAVVLLSVCADATTNGEPTAEEKAKYAADLEARKLAQSKWISEYIEAAKENKYGSPASSK